MLRSYPLEKTIIAISTAQGNGAIAVIRISGIQTFDILSKCFTSKELHSAKGNTILYGHIVDEGTVIDEVLISIFKAPHSYTKEDAAEISCHGSLYIQRKIMSVLIHCGAVLAQPGEFTQRAYLNGRFNLLQAEAVADLIASESASQHALALSQLKGGFTHQLDAMRERLIDLTALLELELDFGEEDVEFADRTILVNTAQEVKEALSQLSASFQYGNAIKKGIPIAIAGPPNVGKSTLLNALLQEEKAIVSEIPGTTRDVIEDTWVLEGVLFRLIDTAGIRQTEDMVESMGIERSKKMIAQSQLTLLLFDSTTSNEYIGSILEIVSAEKKAYIPIRTKSDLPTSDNMVRFEQEIAISAKTGIGLDLLKKELIRVSGLQKGNYDTTVSNVRHYEALKQAEKALDKLLVGLNSGLSTELVAEEMRAALYYIGSITGAVTPDDILGTIFGKFCIGK